MILVTVGTHHQPFDRLVRAAQSLGANPFVAFYQIFLPQSVPGIGAGGLLLNLGRRLNRFVRGRDDNCCPGWRR